MARGQLGPYAWTSWLRAMAVTLGRPPEANLSRYPPWQVVSQYAPPLGPPSECLPLVDIVLGPLVLQTVKPVFL
jgi:hypothetical protein